MTIRTNLLNGNVINRDADFSKYIETVSEPGVIEGLAVSTSSVATGKARVPCERDNGEKIYALVSVSTAVSISGEGDVFIKVSSSLVNDGELMNENGTGIATIEVGTMPSKNALKLATISSGVVTDERNMIKKVGELLTMINTNISDISELYTRVGNLEEEKAINHLEENAFVGELYNLSDILFKQYTPKLADSTLDCNVGDITSNTQIHIQRVGTGEEDNQIKLKVKKIGSPTTNLVVEVWEGTEVDISTSEAYRYGGGQLIASGSISYGDVSSDYAEITVTLNNNFGGTKEELLSVVVYQTNYTVNNSNYYVIACDKTQYSEGLSYVKVNGNTRIRSREIPYCVSDGLSNMILAKKGLMADMGIVTTISESTDTELFTANKTGLYKFTCDLYQSNSSGGHHIQLALNTSASAALNCFASFDQDESGTKQCETVFYMSEGDVLHGYTWHGGYGSGSVSNMKLCAEKSPTNAIPLRPIEVKELGEMGYAMSYGRNPNDEIFYGGYMMGKTSSATTGSITLGNAVGFIETNFNGEIIKIPYYS